MDNTKNDLQQIQEPVQANQTLTVCDDSEELSDSELAAVSGGAGPVSGLVGGLPLVGGLLGPLLGGLGL